MTTPIELNLPITFEQSRDELASNSLDYAAKLAQFVQPVEETEEQIVRMVSRMKGIGRIAILLGDTGSGKSTFIQSLIWRKHLGLARLKSIDCSDLDAQNKLADLVSRLQSACKEANASKGITAISIDYLESLGGTSPEDKRALFQTLNGLLRKTTALIVWPVTTRFDAETMLTEAKAVSSTLFDSQIPILEFRGPKSETFPSIVRNTIAVFNEGKMLQEFLLTEAELDTIRDELVADSEMRPTIRNYIERIHAHWAEKSGYLKIISGKLPKANEVWCVFCHPLAEDVVTSFATKGNSAASAWIAYHAKLWDFVPRTQRLGKWKTPTRLQFAIGGAFTTRILHLSPHALISACSAYGIDPKLSVVTAGAPNNWANKANAKEYMGTTALYKQLVGQQPGKGKTKGGPAANARKSAELPFIALNKLVSGSGNDRHVNRAIAACLKEKLPSTFTVQAETAHPWLPNVTPDIRIDLPDQRQICIEFCYTNNQKPGAVPDYVLDKLITYMEQLEQFIGANIV